MTSVYAHPSFAGLIGAAREEITPPDGIYARNWGAARHETAEGVHRPLALAALTLQTAPDDPPLVLIAADLGWWRRRADEASMRHGLLDALSLDPARAMIAFAHTHSGPALCPEDSDKPGGEFIEPYLDRLRDAAIRATQAALASRRRATLSWTYGKCLLAKNRDLPDPEKPRIVCGFNPDGEADDALLIGRVTGQDGGFIATLVNYACHPTTLAWENRLLSPDFVGAMRETVEARTGGAPCLFLQGATGEFGPMEQYSGDPSLADKNGRVLGYAALSALEGMLPHRTRLRYAGVVESGAPLAIWKREPDEPSEILDATMIEVEFDLKPLPSLDELEEELRACEDRYHAERLTRKIRIRRDIGDGGTTRIPLWVWRVGDAYLVGQMNEAYSPFQRELRRRFPDLAIAAMNVVNGHMGYLPPAPLYDEDLYQAWQTPFERGSLERLIEAATEAIQALS